MKTAALLILSLLTIPACALIGRGAMLENWRLLVLAGAVLACAELGIRYLLA